MLDSSKIASRSDHMIKSNIKSKVDTKVAGFNDGKLGAGGELPHGGAHAHVRHTEEYAWTG